MKNLLFFSKADFQDLYSTIANYKITGENVEIKQELIRSKMKLVDQTAADVKDYFSSRFSFNYRLIFQLNNRLNQCQNNLLPGSAIQTNMKAFSNPQFSKVRTSKIKTKLFRNSFSSSLSHKIDNQLRKFIYLVFIQAVNQI